MNKILELTWLCLAAELTSHTIKKKGVWFYGFERIKDNLQRVFSRKMKSSNEYKKMFAEAVEYQNEYLKNVLTEDRTIIENIIDKFIAAEDKMLEDTFVNAVKYAYKVFQDIKS